MPSDPRLPGRVVIVGAGPAGLAAGIHCARAGLQHLVLERERPGGLLWAAGLVECYPGFPKGIVGPDLAERMVAQALELGVRVERAEATALDWTGKGFELTVNGTVCEARAVVLATGTRPRPFDGLPLPDGPQAQRIQHRTDRLPACLDGQRVWISGGGDAALDSALQLVRRGARVAVAVRARRARALGLLVERALAAGVSLHTERAICAVGAHGSGLQLCFEGQDGVVELADWLLVCHGRDPALRLWHHLASPVARLPANMESHFPGLFLAGDLLRGRCRYAAVATGDGTRAARLAEALLERYHAPPQTPQARGS